MTKTWKRFLGFQEFLDFETLKTKLSTEHSENFDKAEFQIILFEDDLKIWIISNTDKFWFVFDDGVKLKSRSVLKTEFQFKLEEFTDKPNYGKMFVENIEMPIIYNKSFSGNTQNFETRIINLKNKK